MPRLRNVSGAAAVAAFERDGWYVRTKKTRRGSHLWVMKKDGREEHLSIPAKRELKIGTLKQLISAAGLTNDEFEELLKG